MCRRLADQKAEQKTTFAEMREQSQQMDLPSESIDDRDYIFRHPQAMAGLAALADSLALVAVAFRHENKKNMLAKFIRREKDTVVFYNGLKDCAEGGAARKAILDIVRIKRRDVGTVAAALGRLEQNEPI